MSFVRMSPVTATPRTVIPGLVLRPHRATNAGIRHVAPWVPAMNAGMTPVGERAVGRSFSAFPGERWKRETRGRVNWAGHLQRHFERQLPTRPRLSALSRCGRGGKIRGWWQTNTARTTEDRP
jgi:hypothetical protein